MLNLLTIDKDHDVTKKADVYSIHRDLPTNKVVYHTEDLSLWYGDVQALKNINLPIYEKEVTAIIGPSGCGKSTYLKTLNRMRSEEHTSELQSRGHLVCRLLLEKKKKLVIL